MENYVTLFDAKFLPQGLALHASMVRIMNSFRLWILCMDSESFRILNLLNLPHVTLLKLEDYEGPELLGVRAGRSAGEYCWTLTPFVPGFVFDADPSVGRVTYLDADLWFRKSPDPIFLEFEESKKHVLITSHGYAPEYDQSATSGEFCVQFMTFRNTVESTLVRESWAKQCIDWCFARQEDGKFGDQKYLDAWPIKFAGQVHVMNNFAWALAPWNSIRFPYGEAIFHHFQGFRLGRKGKYFLGHYAVPKPTFDSVYKPYFTDIKYALALLEGCGVIPDCQTGEPELNHWQWIKRFARNLIIFRWRFSPDFTGNL
jgi:hypothetical protein